MDGDDSAEEAADEVADELADETDVTESVDAANWRGLGVGLGVGLELRLCREPDLLIASFNPRLRGLGLPLLPILPERPLSPSASGATFGGKPALSLTVHRHASCPTGSAEILLVFGLSTSVGSDDAMLAGMSFRHGKGVCVKNPGTNRGLGASGKIPISVREALSFPGVFSCS